MKFIVMSLLEKEEIFVFPRNVDHDRMFEACEAIRFGGDRNWERKYLRDGECVAAGFIDGGQCHGKSETLGIKSRGEADTKLLAHFIRTAGPAAAPVIDQRERFEAACYSHYLARHAAGKTEDHATPPGPRETLLWRDDAGNYGVLMFNASWWAWQEALK